MNPAVHFATRAEMRELGSEWGRAAGLILAEETLGTPGPAGAGFIRLFGLAGAWHVRSRKRLAA